MYSLIAIATAKLNLADLRAWLADVLARIADHPASRLNELLPSNWKRPQTPETDAAQGSVAAITGRIHFTDSEIRSGEPAIPLAGAARDGELTVEGDMEYSELAPRHAQRTSDTHFAVDRFAGVISRPTRTGSLRLGPQSQPVLGAKLGHRRHDYGFGSALMEMVVDTRFELLRSHDLAGYEVLVHADVPQDNVIFLEDVDATISPLKTEDVRKLSLSRVAAAPANVVYNPTGEDVRSYPRSLAST